MAPKDAKKGAAGDGASANARQPLPPPPAPDSFPNELKQMDKLIGPIPPEWSREELMSTPFAPDDAQKFVDTFFDRRALPRSLAGHCIGWKRAPIAASKDAEYEPEPQAAAEEAEDPKKAGGKGGGKDAKPPAKGGDKGGGKEREMEDVFVNHMDGPKFVVKKLHWYTRDALAPGQLVLDGTAPEWVQWLTSQFVLIAENAPFFSQGTFLWENIHPQDKNGWPLFNPQGLYVVRLFVQGAWRSIRIDDVVPVASDTQALSPRCADDDILWPLLLTKALLTAFQREVGLGVQDIPVVEALTGWRPQKIPLSWPVLSALAYRSPLASIELKSDPEALHGHGHTPLVGATGIPGSGPMSRQTSREVAEKTTMLEGTLAPSTFARKFSNTDIGGGGGSSYSVVASWTRFQIAEVDLQSRWVRLKSHNAKPMGASRVPPPPTRGSLTSPMTQAETPNSAQTKRTAAQTHQGGPLSEAAGSDELSPGGHNSGGGQEEVQSPSSYFMRGHLAIRRPYPAPASLLRGMPPSTEPPPPQVVMTRKEFAAAVAAGEVPAPPSEKEKGKDKGAAAAAAPVEAVALAFGTDSDPPPAIPSMGITYEGGFWMRFEDLRASAQEGFLWRYFPSSDLEEVSLASLWDDRSSEFIPLEPSVLVADLKRLSVVEIVQQRRVPDNEAIKNAIVAKKGGGGGRGRAAPTRGRSQRDELTPLSENVLAPPLLFHFQPLLPLLLPSPEQDPNKMITQVVHNTSHTPAIQTPSALSNLAANLPTVHCDDGECRSFFSRPLADGRSILNSGSQLPTEAVDSAGLPAPAQEATRQALHRAASVDMPRLSIEPVSRLLSNLTPSAVVAALANAVEGLKPPPPPPEDPAAEEDQAAQEGGDGTPAEGAGAAEGGTVKEVKRQARPNRGLLTIARPPKSVVPVDLKPLPSFLVLRGPRSDSVGVPLPEGHVALLISPHCLYGGASFSVSVPKVALDEGSFLRLLPLKQFLKSYCNFHLTSIPMELSPHHAPDQLVYHLRAHFNVFPINLPTLKKEADASAASDGTNGMDKLMEEWKAPETKAIPLLPRLLFFLSFPQTSLLPHSRLLLSALPDALPLSAEVEETPVANEKDKKGGKGAAKNEPVEIPIAVPIDALPSDPIHPEPKDFFDLPTSAMAVCDLSAFLSPVMQKHQNVRAVKGEARKAQAAAGEAGKEETQKDEEKEESSQTVVTPVTCVLSLDASPPFVFPSGAASLTIASPPILSSVEGYLHKTSRVPSREEVAGLCGFPKKETVETSSNEAEKPQETEAEKPKTETVAEDLFEIPDPLVAEKVPQNFNAIFKGEVEVNTHRRVLRELLTNKGETARFAALSISVQQLPGAFLQLRVLVTRPRDPLPPLEDFSLLTPEEKAAQQEASASEEEAGEAQKGGKPDPKAAKGGPPAGSKQEESNASGSQSSAPLPRLPEEIEVLQTEGKEVVSVPHLLLLPEVSYCIEVTLDPFRGPIKLEGGQWTLQICASGGPIELSVDSTQRQLEQQMIEGWEEGAPGRKEKAKAALEKFREERERRAKKAADAEGEEEGKDLEEGKEGEEQEEPQMSMAEFRHALVWNLRQSVTGAYNVLLAEERKLWQKKIEAARKPAEEANEAAAEEKDMNAEDAGEPKESDGTPPRQAAEQGEETAQAEKEEEPPEPTDISVERILTSSLFAPLGLSKTTLSALCGEIDAESKGRVSQLEWAAALNGDPSILEAAAGGGGGAPPSGKGAAGGKDDKGKKKDDKKDDKKGGGKGAPAKPAVEAFRGHPADVDLAALPPTLLKRPLRSEVHKNENVKEFVQQITDTSRRKRILSPRRVISLSDELPYLHDQMRHELKEAQGKRGTAQTDNASIKEQNSNRVQDTRVWRQGNGERWLLFGESEERERLRALFLQRREAIFALRQGLKDQLPLEDLDPLMESAEELEAFCFDEEAVAAGKQRTLMLRHMETMKEYVAKAVEALQQGVERNAKRNPPDPKAAKGGGASSKGKGGAKGDAEEPALAPVYDEDGQLVPLLTEEEKMELSSLLHEVKRLTEEDTKRAEKEKKFNGLGVEWDEAAQGVLKKAEEVKAVCEAPLEKPLETAEA